MEKDKIVPNPYGKLGGPERRKKVVELHQVGKNTKKGFPVKRERVVMEELEKEFEIKPEFHAYNDEMKNKNEK